MRVYMPVYIYIYKCVCVFYTHKTRNSKADLKAFSVSQSQFQPSAIAAATATESVKKSFLINSLGMHIPITPTLTYTITEKTRNMLDATLMITNADAQLRKYNLTDSFLGKMTIVMRKVGGRPRPVNS